jgi:mRNA-degrading endonuclease YafQ of YafQ-DinJ toxin-antitoxin module
MISTVESPGFKRALRKLVKGDPSMADRFREKLRTFLTDPYHPSLGTHKLSGKLKGSLAFTLTYDLRAVFSFLGPNLVLLEDIGDHDDVY